jgi:hypothetical protein
MGPGSGSSFTFYLVKDCESSRGLRDARIIGSSDHRIIGSSDRRTVDLDRWREFPADHAVGAKFLLHCTATSLITHFCAQVR